jgi:Rap1a immunity proteins
MKKLLILLAFCGSAHAEFRDGNKLLSDLQGDIYDRMHALGYIVGVADMGRGFVNCMPENATAGQISDMVKNYLINTPAERHLTGDVIVNKVLKAVWPCAKRGTSL